MTNTNTRPLVPNPDSVTHWSCPARANATLGAGDPHYMIGRRGQSVQACAYCDRTADDLRNEQAEILAGNAEYGSLTDEEKRLTALTAFLAEQVEIDGNNGDASPDEYAQFALAYDLNPLYLHKWAQYVPTADDPLCTVATWADAPEHQRAYVWAQYRTRFGLNDAFDLHRAAHPPKDGDDERADTTLIMTLYRNRDGELCQWNDPSVLVTEWVFYLPTAE